MMHELNVDCDGTTKASNKHDIITEYLVVIILAVLIFELEITAPSFCKTRE